MGPFGTAQQKGLDSVKLLESMTTELPETLYHVGDEKAAAAGVAGRSSSTLSVRARDRRRVRSQLTRGDSDEEDGGPDLMETEAAKRRLHESWRRTMLLALAVTIHNIPEGLAVGVGFGAVGSTAAATFANARNLALGIGIQNFPEGLAVSLPLHRAGVPKLKAFWYGQLSGMVEPIAGIFGVVAISVSQPDGSGGHTQ